MFIFRVEDVRKEWNGNSIFESVSMEIQEGEKVALIGRNGTGKTSLIQLIMGKTPCDEGRIERKVPLSEWGWLEQDLEVDADETLRSFVESASPLLADVKNKLSAFERRMNAVGTSDGSETSDVLHEQYANLIAEYLEQGGYDWEHRVEKSLMQLQLPPDAWNTRYRSLSGGQKTRAQLCKLMVQTPRVLILDEPTNHLDEETLAWLESWLRGFRGTVLFTSHDRRFIDNVATAVYELTAEGAARYKGGYSSFRVQKDLEIRTQQALYERQQNERTALLEAIQQYKEWYERGHNAASERDPFAKKRASKNATRFKAKERALERLEKEMVDRPSDGFQIDMRFIDEGFDVRTLLVADDVTFAYEETPIIRGASLEVVRRDRIAITGPNGCGKTTFLKLLTQRLIPNAGSVRHHPRLQIGYFAQELDGLNESETILETVLHIPGMTQTYARTILASFLFRNDDVFKRVGTLSMGERCRVAFVKLYFSEANLLVLDEPTNYLDIETRERIEEALFEYPGSYILVSHDRYFVDKVANRIVSLEEGGCVVYQGTYAEFKDQALQPPIDLNVQNEISRLELQMTQLMGEEELSDEARRTEVLYLIRETKNQLDALRKSIGRP